MSIKLHFLKTVVEQLHFIKSVVIQLQNYTLLLYEVPIYIIIIYREYSGGYGGRSPPQGLDTIRTANNVIVKGCGALVGV